MSPLKCAAERVRVTVFRSIIRTGYKFSEVMMKYSIIKIPVLTDTGHESILSCGNKEIVYF